MRARLPYLPIALAVVLIGASYGQQVRLSEKGEEALKEDEAARRFGQSPQEREKVTATLDRVRLLMKARMKPVDSGHQESSAANTVRTGGEDSVRRDFVSENHPPRPSSLDQEHGLGGLRSRGMRRPGRFLDSDHSGHNPEEFGRHFEGDIVLTGDQADQLYEMVSLGDERRTKRKFVASPARRWDTVNPIVDYSFDGAHSPKEQKVIEVALQHWSNVTCINFNRRDDPPRGSRIVFTDVDGCASNVGRNPANEPQYVSLSTECLRLGVIAHEVAHALGFWHEQSRPDRDNYVDVLWKNIDGDSLGQFLKEKASDVDTEGIAYDYGSVMHYRSKAFAKSDGLFTLLTDVRDYQRTIGQRDQLSFNDIRLMNVIYCSHRCSAPLTCQRAGYTDPRTCSHCRCPDGFTGTHCEKVMDGYGARCGGTLDLTAEWTFINSPNYPNRFDEGQECSWLVKAPPGQRVQMEFTGQFELFCKVEHSLCMDYVEVKNSTDFANTGMRYCCNQTPQGTITSASEEMLVLFRSFYRSATGFKARLRSAPPKT